MNNSSWEGSPGMLNQRDMAGMRPNLNQGTRSQDDANVGYLYQRSHSDVPIGGGFPPKRWAVGDDLSLEQKHQMTSVQDLERQFQGINMSSVPGRPDIGHQKKLWDDEPNKAEGQPKSSMFSHHGWATRDDTWATNPQDSSNQIGVNMVEVLLGGSPNKLGEPNALNRIKPFPQSQDPHMSEEPKKSKTPSPFEQEVGAGDEGKENLQANGLISNGLEDGGFRSSRQTSPADEERAAAVGMGMDPQKMHMRGDGDFLDNGQPPVNFNLDTHPGTQFEQVGLDNMPYGNDFSSQMMPSMESPNNYNLDINQQLMQRQQQPIAMLPQQPFTMPGQQPLGK